MTDETPMIRVVRGQPTDEELAALVTVLSSLGGDRGSAATLTSTPSGWSAYWRSLRAPLAPGPQAWRLSGRS